MTWCPSALCRLLSGASSPIDADPGHGEGLAAASMPWLEGFIARGEPGGCRWPVVLSAEALAVSAQLLHCDAATSQQRARAYMMRAVVIGDLRLVGLVLQAFPGALLESEWQGTSDVSSAVAWACHNLCYELPHRGPSQGPVS